MISPAYCNWEIRIYCGETPDFPSPRLQAHGNCTVAWEKWALLLDTSIALVNKLADATEELELLSQISPSAVPIDPLLAWIRPIFNHFGVPDYPLYSIIEEDGGIRLDFVCPYMDAVKTVLVLVSSLLGMGLASMQHGQVTLNIANLSQLVNRLPHLFPHPSDMAIHAALSAQGTSWEWLGGTHTRIGQGRRQRVIDLVPHHDNILESQEIAALFPAEELRIPIYTVTGSIGKTTTIRLLGQLMETSGLTIGLTASDGAWIGDQLWQEGDCIGGVTAQALLRRPDIDAAILEQGRGGIIKQGIPFSSSDIAVLLNVQNVHLGLDGINTQEEMANIKGVSLKRAKLAVLNHDDEQCRRIGAQRKSVSCVWFSLTADEDTLRVLSLNAHGTLGVSRESNNRPLTLDIWQQGKRIKHLSLNGITPFHGMLSEKTLEELLAAVGAAWFGPVAIPNWDTALQRLSLNTQNHLFRCSVHRQGNLIFVLDKAGEEASLITLETFINELCANEEVEHRIGVLTRAAGEHPSQHLKSCIHCYRFLDEFICFDRPDTYTGPAALPIYTPGSIPLLLQQELENLNKNHNCHKPVSVLKDWEATEEHLRLNLAPNDLKTLVLINQPSTAVSELNERIIHFVNNFSEMADR